ncbi:ferredoxin [Paludisphaera soli]|uniref:ferredoxin n=1 Tax=Paludisphaera soli TaxID=2712865 RepID=UPI0013EDD8C5|nr:ferredoxin [Paludisphaera soli]
MADPALRTPENASGRFYVDENCIDCDLCHETAPGVFARNEDEGRSFVARQPASPEEEALCREALESCPVEAIGDDG